VTQPAPDSLEQLLAAACNGTITPEQIAQLDAILLNDSQARLAYLQHVHVEAKLHRIFRSKGALSPGETSTIQQALSAIVGGSVAGVKPPTEESPSGQSLHDAMIMPALAELEESTRNHENSEPDPFTSLTPEEVCTARPRIAFGWMWPIAAVLFLTISAGVAFLALRPRVAPAVLTASIKADWDTADSTTKVPVIGEHLPRTLLNLHDGLAQLTFDNGADVVIQGPAQFQITAAGQLDLRVGQLTAHVPGPAIGFTVKTPHATVTDLGTEFGVNVSADLQTHAEVFVGKVRATAADPAHPDAAAPNRTLLAGLAVNIPDAAKIEDAAPAPLSFVRPEQFADLQQQGDSSYSRWLAFSRQLRADPSLLVYYTFDKADSAQLLNQADVTRGSIDGNIQSADWQAGRFAEKEALHFNGADSIANVNIPGKFRQLSYAAWINLAHVDHEFTSIVTSQLASVRITGAASPAKPIRSVPIEPAVPSTNGACHLSLFQSSKVHPCIRMGISDNTQLTHWSNFDFPSAALIDHLNQWHLLVVSCNLDHHTIRCWIDAKFIGELPIDFPTPLQIGPADIGNLTGSFRGLNGAIDELAIWSRPLSESEVQSMYHAGLPPS